jgi:hypothetical protein
MLLKTGGILEGPLKESAEKLCHFVEKLYLAAHLNVCTVSQPTPELLPEAKPVLASKGW